MVCRPATPAMSAFSARRTSARARHFRPSLRAACVHLREALGAAFVDYLLTIKDAETARFQAEVTDWEQREYFEMY